MAWLVFHVGLGLFAATGIIVSVNRLRFDRHVFHEMRSLVDRSPARAPSASAAALPAPVARYRQLAVGTRVPVRTLSLRHGGTFCVDPKAKPQPIRGTQFFTADPPAFVWTGRVHVAPGVWIDARDMMTDGAGSMRVLLDDTVTLVNARGPQIDQAAALRLLAEMPWYPTALFDSRYVTWEAIDTARASATLSVGATTVTAMFEFGAEGLPTRMTARRLTDKGELLPWGGVYRDYRDVSGMRVPFEAEVTWQLDTGPFTYAHWLIESMDYDQRPQA
jgi:hypothetical protein